jgi:hypothetical protein
MANQERRDGRRGEYVANSREIIPVDIKFEYEDEDRPEKEGGDEPKSQMTGEMGK